MRATLLLFAVFALVTMTVAIAPLASSSPNTAVAAACVPAQGPGIAPPASVPSGIEGFHAAWYGQSGYQSLCPGQLASAVVAFYNSGSFGWVSGRMGEAAYLGTWDPEPGQDRPSAVGGDGQFGSPATGWPRYNRVATQPAPYVGPGQVAWFQFSLRAPSTPGTYRLALRPLIEGATWMEDYGVFWVFTVLPVDGGGGGGGGATPAPTAAASATATASATSTAAGGSGFVGNSAVESAQDPSTVGQAEATQYTATTSGAVSTISIFLDSSNAATNIALGIYSDAAGVPGTLLAQGSRTGVTSGAWNSVAIPTLSITAGTPYWIARLAVSGGTVVTRGNNAAGNADRVDTRFLSALPTTFSPGASFPHRASMYAGTATGGTPPPTPSPTPPPTVTPQPTPTSTPGSGGAFTCTQFVGYSQTNNWFGDANGFRVVSGLDARRYEMLWNGGGAVLYWADPGYAGWNNGVAFPCATNAYAPDRVVMDVTEDFYLDDPANGGVSRVATDIRNVIATIRARYPSVRQIYVQPVVGGPGGSTCVVGGVNVRASVNHPYISQAIDQVIAQGTPGFDVRRGPNPTVSSCSGYADNIGHLADGGTVGQAIGNWYAVNTQQ